MTAFLIGFAISALAAVPSLLLVIRKRSGEFRIRLKFWIIGMAIRFLIIGISLLLLFTWTEIDRLAVVIGILVAYFTSYMAEVIVAYRSH